jgi:lysophospholipase L1-like esterase
MRSSAALLLLALAGCAPRLAPVARGSAPAVPPVRVAVFRPVDARNAPPDRELSDDAPVVVREAILRELSHAGCPWVDVDTLDDLVGRNVASGDLTWEEAARLSQRAGADLAVVGRITDYRRGSLLGRSTVVGIRLDVVAPDARTAWTLQHRETAAQEDPAILARDVGTKVARALLKAWGTRLVDPSDPSIRPLGRVVRETGSARWAWSGSGIQFAFRGTGCRARIRGSGAVLRVRLDGREAGTLSTRPGTDSVYTLAADVADAPHVVELRQRTEAATGGTELLGLSVDGVPSILPPPPARRIAFYGNSITCGYGILDSSRDHHFSPATEDEGSAFGALAADSLGADRRTVCWSGRGVVRNFGGDTATATLPEVADRALASESPVWTDDGWTPDAIVVELGHNDFTSLPAPDSAAFESTLTEFVQTRLREDPRARVVLVDGPMTSDAWPQGLLALTRLRAHLDRVAAGLRARGVRASHLSLTPNDASRGWGADWHPNQAQARLNASELVAHLRREMGW